MQKYFKLFSKYPLTNPMDYYIIRLSNKTSDSKEDKTMKAYGANKATEFTKKQISVIYGKAKAGELKVEKWYMSRLYDLADYYGYDDNRSVEQEERGILELIENVFAGQLEKAQETINEAQERVFNLMSRKYQAKCNHEYI